MENLTLTPQVVRRLDETGRRYTELMARRTLLTTELERHTKLVGEAKYRISLKPQVDDLLLDLQRQNHQRTVGMYEALLTQIMQEVVPNDGKHIAMAMGTTGGVPTLDIMVEKKPGQTEDILTGNGGSVVNVIGAGLRYIALSRTSLRKFIVLDESDCWLKSTNVASFYNVVGQLGSDLGVQSIVVSHHDAHLFTASASSIVSLTRENGVITPHYVYDLKNPPREGQLEFIRLVDFMGHEDTTIPLSSGVTAITGEVDIGKSAIGVALAALSGIRPFKKEYIRHECNKATVSVGLVGGAVIECTRNLKGSPAVTYRMTEADGTLSHQSDGEAVWLDAILGIRTEGGLDIQVGNQKSPVFLLDESGSKQASILSIGRESGLITAMQADYKKSIAEDKQVVKAGEEAVLNLRRQLTALEALDTLPLETLRQSAEQIASVAGATAEMAALIARLTLAAEARASFEAVKALPVPVVPVLQSTAWLMGALPRLTRLAGIDMQLPVTPAVPALHPGLTGLLDGLQRVAGLSAARLPESVVAPALVDGSVLHDLLSRLMLVNEPLMLPAVVTPPTLLDTISLAEVGRNLQASGKTLRAASMEYDGVKSEVAEVATQYQQVVDALGGVCPLCHNPMGGHAH